MKLRESLRAKRPKIPSIPQKLINKAVDQLVLILHDRDKIDELIEKHTADLPDSINKLIKDQIHAIFDDLKEQVLKETSEYYKKEEK